MKLFYRPIKLAAVVVLTIIFFVALLSQLNRIAQAAPSAELDVCATCTYTTIQTAVNAADPGDTIRVAAGTYTGMMSASELTATVVLTKDLILLGGFGPDFSQRDPDTYVTTIDTEGNLWGGVLIHGSQSEVNGFHIVNAYGGGVAIVDTAVGTITNNHIANNRIVTGTQLSQGGAGIDVSSGAEATIANNEIVSNTISRAASYGGGIRLIDATAEIYGNIIAYNLTYDDTVGGGLDVFRSTVVITGNSVHHNANVGIGIYESKAEVMSNTIDSNTTIYDGGGMDINNGSTFTLTANVISNNSVQFYDGGGLAVGGQSNGIILDNEFVSNVAINGGGGIYINGDSSSEPFLIEGNIFHGNTSEYGAALLVSNTYGEVTMSRNDIRFNQVTGEDYQAGGIYITDVGDKVTVVNNVVAHNDNRGVKGVNYTEIELINNTIVSNGSQAIEMLAWPVASTVPMTATVVNNIIADHPDCAFSGFNNAVFEVHSSDVVGHDPDDCGAEIVSQSDNINADPQFVNPAAGNYQLQVGSPTIDSGMGGLNIPNVDIDGTSRPQGSGVDMGAYEAVFHQVFLPTVIKPSVPPSDNFIIENRALGQGYVFSGGDVHAWLSAIDGWGFAPQDSTNVTFYRWNGTKWNLSQTLPSGGMYCGADLKILSATNGWAVTQRDCTFGPSTFFHWNGSQWLEVQSGIDAGIWAMDFRSDNDGWAVGYASHCCGAKFFHWDGVSWTEKKYLISHWPVSDIALLDNGDGWAVGSSIARQSGNDWIVYSKPVSESVYAVSMVSVSDGWAVGEAGTILHWNGTAWTAVASPTTEDLRDIEMVQSNHGWAVGQNGVILRWNGTVWSQVASSVNADFYELDMIGINEGWIPYYRSGTATYGVLHITTP